MNCSRKCRQPCRIPQSNFFCFQGSWLTVRFCDSLCIIIPDVISPSVIVLYHIPCKMSIYSQWFAIKSAFSIRVIDGVWAEYQKRNRFYYYIKYIFSAYQLLEVSCTRKSHRTSNLRIPLAFFANMWYTIRTTRELVSRLRGRRLSLRPITWFG